MRETMNTPVEIDSPNKNSAYADEAVAERDQLSRAVDGALIRGEFQAALEQASAALQRYEAAQDREGLALSHFLLGKCYRRLNDPSASLRHHEESYARYQAMAETMRAADVLMAKSGTLRLLGRDVEAVRDLKQCRAIYEQAGERTQEMRAAMNLSILYKQAGDVAASQELLYECLSYFEQKNQTGDTAKVLLNIATNYNVLLQMDEAIRFARLGIPLFEAAGDLHNLSQALCVLGTSYLKKGDYETALEQFQTALRIAEQVGIRWVNAIILDDISTALMRLKRFEEAREAIEQCLCLNDEDANRLVYAGNLAQMGRLYAHAGYAGRDIPKALAYLHEARRIAEDNNTIFLQAEIYNTLTELHENEGDHKQALESFRAFHAAEKRLFNEESDKRIQRLEAEKAQKDAEIAHLRMVELTQALEEAERLRALADERARTDALTGVLNRRALNEYLEEEFERSLRYDRPFAVALADVDHFKQINDTLGHGVGDAVLRHLAQLLITNCRTGDRVARYGGEEFALLLPETDAEMATVLCERLRLHVATEDWTSIHPGLTSVTISVGVSAFSRERTQQRGLPRDLLDAADQNLYVAKRGGRNKVVGVP
jgi:diguanylate cyclase (GGDEF)-like protein